MWRFCVGALAVLMLAPAVRAQEDTEKKVEPPTPTQQYSQLMSDYQKARLDVTAKFQKADASERPKILADFTAQTNELAEKFWKLASDNPDDRVAQNAVRWIFQYASRSPSATAAATSLLEKAGKDPKSPQSLSNVILVATRTSGPVAKEAAGLLIELVESNKNDPTMIAPLTSLISSPSTPRELATKAGEILIALIESKKDDPAMITPLTALLSSRTAPKQLAETATQLLIDNFANDDRLASVSLRLGNHDALRQVIEKTTNDSVKGHAMFSLGRALAGRPVTPNKEAEELLAKVVSDYADIESGGSTLGKMAEGPLFEMRHLQIGMAAPNIQGEDVDSEAFELADYKGKVVVLDFWGDW